MTARSVPSRPSRVLAVTTGISGLLATVLVFGAQALIQVGGNEPPFDATAAETADFFATRDRVLFAAGSYLTVVALLVFVWFLGGAWALLQRAEGEPAWRSTIALGSGIVFVAGTLSGGWELAAFRADQGLDPQLARFAFDMGNLWFASSWVAIAGFLLATAWVILEAHSLPRWLGWWALVAGIGLLGARAAWTSPIWFLPYALFWLWVVTVSLLLIRRRGATGPTPTPDQPDDLATPTATREMTP